MRGFTGEVYNGVPVFVREEYEAYHWGMSEVDRLNEYFGTSYDNPVSVFTYAEQVAPSLMYGKKDLHTDMVLRDGADWEAQWEPYGDGWVHRITGEYVKGSFPDRDSYPFWCLKAPKTYISSKDAKGLTEGLTELATGLAVLIGLGSLLNEDYDEDEEFYDEDDEEEEDE